MTNEEVREALLAIKQVMAEIAPLAERLAGYVHDLERGGIDLPNMKQTATTLAEIALGWTAGERAGE